jgi:3-oxoacyl-[acyl-carrier-protein] synthase III
VETPEAMTDCRNPVDLGRFEYLRRMQVYSAPYSRITAIGGALPDRVVDNEELVGMLDAPAALKKRLPELIERVTGVRTRRMADRFAAPSDLALVAAREALDAAGLVADDIDTLIFASTDTDVIEPATANILQKKLGIERVNSFDVSNACNSILQAVSVANGLIAAGGARRVLIAGAEIGTYWASRTLADWEDLRVKLGGLTLGDAGAALVVEPTDGSSGILEINLLSLGGCWEMCHIPEDVNWRKNGRSIHGWFYLNIGELVDLARPSTIQYFGEYVRYRQEALGEDQPADTLAKVIPHQISKVLIDELAAATAPGRSNLVAVSADEWGNIGSCSIPLTLRRAMIDDGLAFGCGRDVLLYGAASGYSLGHLRVRL